jgi:Tol biopolymer transport system component
MLSPDGSKLAVRSERRKISVYDLHSMEKVRDIEFAKVIASAQFSFDGSELRTITGDQQVHRIKLGTTVARK